MTSFEHPRCHRRVLGRVAPTIAAAALLLVACGSEPAELVLADDAPGEVSSDAPVSLADADPTTTTIMPVAPTDPPSTTTPATTTTQAPPDERVEMLGGAMIGIGEWAILRPPADDEFDCRNDGTLAFVVDGDVVHRYDQIGGLGGVELFNGTRGQDAFVVNCEESVERILIQGSAFLPSTGWPEVTEFRLYDGKFEDYALEFGSDFGWRADMFSAHARHRIGGVSYNELFVFDPSGPTIDPVHARLGTRTITAARAGFDLVVPSSWTSDSTDGYLTVANPDTSSFVQVTRRDAEATPEPLAEGDEFLSSDSVDEHIWSLPDNEGRARIESKIAATEWFFIADDGVRLVRHISVGDDIVEIEMYADDDDPSINRDLPWLVVELVRAFDN